MGLRICTNNKLAGDTRASVRRTMLCGVRSVCATVAGQKMTAPCLLEAYVVLSKSLATRQSICTHTGLLRREPLGFALE